jgi:hypothetical protein
MLIIRRKRNIASTKKKNYFSNIHLHQSGFNCWKQKPLSIPRHVMQGIGSLKHSGRV